jgi:hypothetical protein
MTYNFDPDRWYENERMRVELRKRSGEIDEKQAEEALKALERRYEDMVARLDGTFPVRREDSTEQRRH